MKQLPSMFLDGQTLNSKADTEHKETSLGQSVVCGWVWGGRVLSFPSQVGIDSLVSSHSE